jgi:uncharacterized protein involved in exopolysaccharide biosynthesis
MNSASIDQSLESHHVITAGANGQVKDYSFDVRRSIRMHKTLFIATATLVFVAVFGFGISRRPYYETQALIYVQPMKTKLITDTSEGAYDSSRYETYIQQQLQTIVRPDILEEALSKPSTRAWRFRGEPLQAAVLRLQHSLKVDRVTESYELSIGLSGSDPVAIADVVNAVSNAYIHGERSDELAQSDQQLQILEDELQRVSVNLANDHREQAELSVRLGVADTSGDTANPYDVQLTELRSELAKAAAAHDVAAAQAASVSSGQPGSSESLRAAADDVAATDPGLSSLKQTIGQRRSLLSSQMSGLTPKNPLYQQDVDELRRLDASLLEMESEVRVKAAKQLELRLQLEARRTADIEAKLSQQLDAQTAIATGATPQLQRAADLAADIARLQARYNLVDNAINSIELEKDTSGLVHILTPALPPLAPKTSARRLILAGAFPLALGLGIIATVLRSKLDPKIYTGKDISRTVKFYPMAVLPEPEETSRVVRDEFMLRLLAGIDQIHRTDGAKTFVFTAASDGLAVSELVGSLSRKMERLGYRVATLKASDLVEAPVLSSGLFEIPENDTAETIVQLPKENFVAHRVESIKKDVNFLFIEALPLLVSSEAEFAARLSDVVVLIAESGHATRNELRDSLSLVKRLKVPGVAVVLSHVRVRQADDEFISTVKSVQSRFVKA